MDNTAATDPILIAGGGIAGLSAALALSRIGWPVKVYETSPVPIEGGTGLWLWPNAMAALGWMGIDQAVCQAGAPHAASRISDYRGRELTMLDPGLIGDPQQSSSPVSSGAPSSTTSVAIRRAELMRVLIDALDPEVIQFGTRCLGFSQDADGVDVQFSDGTTARGTLLVGADGWGSAVRRQLVGAEPVRSAGYTAWRAVIPFDDPRAEAGMSWGVGQRFGFMPLGHGLVNWFGGISLPQSTLATLRPGPATKAMLLERYGDWHAPIPQAIEATDPEAILCHPIQTRPYLGAWGTGRVTLLGDAAHAMTPSLGQGACQALEDAVVLASALADTPADIPAALSHYGRTRRPRAYDIARRSAFADYVIQCRWPLLCALRDTALHYAPPALVRRQVRHLVTFRCPT